MEQLRIKIEEALKHRYQYMMINGQLSFLIDNGFVCRVDYINCFRSIVMEYADNLRIAKNGGFEDGDLFYVDDKTEEELIENVLFEVSEWKK